MSTLKEFIAADQNAAFETPLLSGTTLSTNIRNAVAPLAPKEVDIFGRPKKDLGADFSNKLSDVVQSPDFLDRLSNEVGTPGISETEDMFVERAKAAMKKILLEKLDR